MSTIESVMAFHADTALAFSDGVVRCNSIVLSLASTVLRTALELESNQQRADGGCKYRIPIQGCTRAEWLEVAPFWYPGSSEIPDFTGTDQVELIIKVASQFALSAAAVHADNFLAAHISRRFMDTEDTIKWLKFACSYRMPKSLAAAAKYTAQCHHKALTDDASVLDGMPADTLKQMLVQAAHSLVNLSGLHNSYSDGDFPCHNCNHPDDEHNGGAPFTHHVLSWVCGKCHHTSPACN